MLTQIPLIPLFMPMIMISGVTFLHLSLRGTCEKCRWHSPLRLSHLKVRCYFPVCSYTGCLWKERDIVKEKLLNRMKFRMFTVDWIEGNCHRSGGKPLPMMWLGFYLAGELEHKKFMVQVHVLYTINHQCQNQEIVTLACHEFVWLELTALEIKGFYFDT